MRALLLATLFLAAPALAESAEPVVCFTPGQDCTGIIVEEISGAQQILVQAYSSPRSLSWRRLRPPMPAGSTWR